MKGLSVAIFVALFLAGGVLAQTDQPGTPGMQAPSGSKPLIHIQQQATPGRQHGVEHMEMLNQESTGSHVTGVQEPENPDHQTGSSLPVPDLLQMAKRTPPKHLAEFEALALKKNPTLKQAQSIVQTSAGLARQAGLWPNPSVGYLGEEIRGGSSRGGEQGAFVQQNIVLGGKLRLRRNAYAQQRKADEIGVEEQQLDVRGAVQMYFYSALAQLRRVETRRELLSVASDAAATAQQLANVGQADAPDILQAEVEAEQAKLQFVRAQREYIQFYKQLAAVAGDPGMPLALLEGNLENPPAIDPDNYVQDLLANSPTLKRAQLEASNAEAELARDKREAVPDLLLRAGAQQNREINDLSGKPVGAQGFATASIQLPIFNRNQGNVEASQAKVERAQQEVERIRLQLLQTAEPLVQQYLTSRFAAERYQQEIIPRAQRAYELYLGNYHKMVAAYPEVLISQRTLFQLKDDYVLTLGELWTTSVQLQSYLLANGLTAPTPSGSTSTQINLPTSNSGGTD